MPAAGRGIDHHHVPLAEQAAENRFVGIGAANGSDLGMITLEHDFKIGLELVLNFVNIGSAAVVAFSWMPLGVAMGKIRTGLGLDPLTDHVFTGNKIDAFIPPFILAAD